MTTVTISPKYQVVIPSTIRKNSSLTPGMKLEVLQMNDQIILVPIKSMKELKGSFKGLLSPNIEREKTDRPL